MAVTKAQVAGNNQQSLIEADKQDLRNVLGLIQESTVITVDVNNHSKLDAQDAVNGAQPTNINDVSSAYIKTIKSNNTSITTRLWKLISKPENSFSYNLTNGNYGLNAKQINYRNLELARQELKASSNDLENAPGTVTENLGDIGTTSVKDYINGLTNGLTLINSTDTLTVIKAIVNSLDISYRYVGGDATYGANDSTIADSNLELLEQETNTIIPSLQQVTHKGNETDNYIKVNNLKLKNIGSSGEFNIRGVSNVIQFNKNNSLRFQIDNFGIIFKDLNGHDIELKSNLVSASRIYKFPDKSGTLALKSYADEQRHNGYTVADLPTGEVGQTAYVTDAASISYRAVATGGGNKNALVFYDGTNWIYH